jgi:DNA polymerase/3'-5' exonuclease PolX
MDARERKRLIEVRAVALELKQALEQSLADDQLEALCAADYVGLLERNLVIARDLIKRCTRALGE